MKKTMKLILCCWVFLLVACGQKGPLIVEVPTKTTGSSTIPEVVEKEVSEDEPVINIQTDDNSSAR